ncbi:gamma-interferon-inducible protein 16 isoform X1 [Lemur catta]|uniref:gamma-interferon-inducible protein 16 isoform X1 n=2 Tax=Lemur catta TaxID=9447 RepID=UPI001E26C41C|nr:gamma-interferon-inducible protein 16 isoform X1 [Lemur catta]
MSLDMANERWKVVLLNGLEDFNEYQFKMIKFLLAKKLKLTEKMQEEYDKVKIANLMVKKFKCDVSVDKLIQLCKNIPALQHIAETLRKEKSKAKGTTPSKKKKQKEVGPATPVRTTSKGLTSEGAEVTPGPQKRKNTAKGKDGTKRIKVSEEQTQPPCPAGAGTSTAVGHPPPPQMSSAPPNNSSTEHAQQPKPPATSQATTRKPDLRKGPMVVMVLSAADPFAYESSEKETKTMFHATVATEKQFFHMKVFNINLKRKFIRNRIIILSDYFENAHVLEVNEASSVSEACPDQKMEVPNNIKKRAKETLPIDIIKTQASGAIVYGLFMLHKKIVNKNNTIYEIQDNTGNMEVVGKGKCHNIPCEEGDKLQLFCFRLRKKKQTPTKLISEIHSFIQVKKKTNQRNSKTLKLSEEQNEVLKHSEASAALIQSHPWTPQMPPAAPSSTFLRKKEEAIPGAETSSANVRFSTPTVAYAHIYAPHQKTPSSRVLSKKEDRITQTKDTMRIQMSQEDSQLSGLFATGTCPTESIPQTPQMPPATTSSSPLTKKSRSKPIPKEASIEEGHQSGPIKVMVLRATEPFVYEIKEEKKMFHATVATESEFFQVKVFNINLKEKFTPKKIITISDYMGRNGFLEVYPFSSVSDVGADRKMEISSRLIKNANATPKINHLCSQTKEKFVNGVFMVHKKNVRDKCTYYEIQDNTGKMEVVVYGRLTKVNCEEGDKLKLICFELACTSEDNWQLRSVRHSYIQVIKARKSNKQTLNPDSYMETSLESSF